MRRRAGQPNAKVIRKMRNGKWRAKEAKSNKKKRNEKI